MKKHENRPNFPSKIGNFAQKTFVALVAGVALLVAGPSAVAQISWTDDGTTATATGSADSNSRTTDLGVTTQIGVLIDSGTAPGVNIFDLSGATINVTSIHGGSDRAILTTLEDATFILDNGTAKTISITKTINTDSLAASTGFFYLTDNTGPAFSGNIFGDKTTISSTSLHGRADGLGFWRLNAAGIAIENDAVDIVDTAEIHLFKVVATAETEAYGFQAGAIRDTADINIGSIVATGKTAAYGFIVGEVESGTAIDLDGVSATTNTGSATAVNFYGNIASGDVSLGNLVASTTNSNARGLLVGIFGQGAGDGFHDITGMVTLGSVTATSTTGNAYGVEAGEANLTLQGDIVASGAGANTSGIRTHGVTDIILGGAAGGTIDIRATTGGVANSNGIWTNGTTSINLAGRSLTTSGVRVDGGSNNLSIIGNGFADLGVITMEGGTITIGDGTNPMTFAFNVGASQLGETTEHVLHSGVTFEFYGSALNERDHWGLFTVTGGDIEDIVYSSTGSTRWGFEERENGLYALVNMGSLGMSDGYLAAFTMHNRYAAWHAVRDRMISGNGFAPRPSRSHHGYYLGQSPCYCDACSPISYGYSPCDPIMVNPCDPCGPGSFAHRGYDVARDAWVNYTGRSDTYYSSFHGENWRLSTEGVQAGADLFRTTHGQLGVLFGYESGKTTNKDDRVKMDDMYFGAYAAKVLYNGADIRGVFAYGWQDYDMRRRANGNGFYTSTFKGNSMEANLELGKRLAAGAWSLRPVVAVDVFNNKIKGATEVGGATYDKIDLTQTFLRTGTELRYRMRHFTFNSGVYYAYDLNGKELKTRATNGAYDMQLTGAKLGRELLTFNLGGEYWLAQSLSVFGGYQGEYVMDRTNSRVHNAGYIGAGFKW